MDEVGEIPLELQTKLLRVLQEREFERLGSSRTIKTDARLVAATNRNLSEMVEQRQFRAGTSTLFLVQQRQTTMITARSQERRAESDLSDAISVYELVTGSNLRRHNINLQ